MLTNNNGEYQKDEFWTHWGIADYVSELQGVTVGCQVVWSYIEGFPKTFKTEFQESVEPYYIKGARIEENGEEISIDEFSEHLDEWTNYDFSLIKNKI